MGWCGKFWSVILEYDTVKFVRVKNKKVGLMYRTVQLTILGYIIGYVLVVNKGYQQFSDVESAVTTKVKGVVYTNFSKEEFHPSINDTDLYRRIWDISDLVIPPSENDAFFIATNVIITPNQTVSTCAEEPSTPGALCDPQNNTCVAGYPFLLGSGVSTGNCIAIPSNSTVYTCEINGWCPLEVDEGPLNSQALLTDTGNFTVLIKSFINFPLYDLSRRNILNTQDKAYLANCRYDNVTDPLCPVFILRDIVRHAGFDYDQMALKGGVVAVVINWECNLDFHVEKCFPSYSFKRLDNPGAVLAPGWNFRYSNYFSNDQRTLYKLYGIDFVIVVTGRGGRFYIVPLLLNIGSGLALMTVASVISDLCILYIVKKKELYNSKKYKLVHTEYDEFRNPQNPDYSDVHKRSSPNRSEYTHQFDEG